MPKDNFKKLNRKKKIAMIRANGNLVIKTASAHGLSVGDLIRINDGGITFTCATDSNGSLHPYPRSTDPASNKILTITAVTTDTFTVNVGTSSDTSTHTFHSAVTNSIKKINSRFNVVNAVYNGGPGIKNIHEETGLNAGEIVLVGWNQCKIDPCFLIDAAYDDKGTKKSLDPMLKVPTGF